MLDRSALLVLLGICGLCDARGSSFQAQIESPHQVAANNYAVEWPSYRGTRSLNGHAKGVGNIHTLAVAWRHQFGTSKLRAVVHPNTAVVDRTVQIPNESLFVGRSSDQTEWFPPRKIGLIAGQVQTFGSTPTTAYEATADERIRTSQQ